MCYVFLGLLKSLFQTLRYHESQLSEADWHLHSTHDPDEVQVDPRGLSDVTDEEEVQVCLTYILTSICIFLLKQLVSPYYFFYL